MSVSDSRVFRNAFEWCAYTPPADDVVGGQVLESWRERERERVHICKWRRPAGPGAPYVAVNARRRV